MKSEKRIADWEVWCVAIVVSLAAIALLHYRGVNGETVAETIQNIGAAVIPILAAFVAARLVMRNMSLDEKCLHVGEDALRRLQAKNPGMLKGPKANRENYDQENSGDVGRYIFFQRNNNGRKAQFIPLQPLKDGIVEIRVPKMAMLLLGSEREGLETVQQDLLAKVQASVKTMLERNYPGSFEILSHKHEDIAIVVDFDESRLSLRRFGKAVEACADTALKTVVDTLR